MRRGARIGGLVVLLGLLAAPAAARADDRPARRATAVGFDLALGLPHGFVAGPVVGLDLVVQPFGPLSLTAGGTSNGATWSVHGEVQLNLLTFFTADPWTPFVRAGLSHLRFTRVADDLVDTLAPTARDELAQAGTDLRLAGLRMNLATVSAGIDCLTGGGFHFQLAVGRAFLLGESGGTDDEEGVVVTDYASWTFELTFGWVFW